MKNLLLILFVMAISVGFAQNSQKNFIDQNYIEVTGKSEINITPDLVYLNVEIKEQDSKNKISVEEQEQKLISILKEAGINMTEDFRIKDMTSSYKDYLLGKSKFELL